jgi:hypothetical protein
MYKDNTIGMQVKTVCPLTAVKGVAEYRIAEPVLVGTVHTELMGTSSLGEESDSRELRIRN